MERRERLRVVHVLRVYLPRSETFVYTTLRGHRRYAPAVLAGALENLDEFPLDGVEQVLEPAPGWRRGLRRLGALAARAPSSWDHALARAAGRHGAVMLHAHFGPTGWRALHAAERLGVPLLTTFYGFDLAFARERSEWGPRYAELFKRGALFACEGPAMVEQLAAIGCPRERIRLVRIPLELERFTFAPRERSRPLVLLQTGRFVPKKGFDLAVRAFARARAELGDSELWLVGDGPQRPAVEALARECGVESGVRFLGMVSHAEYREVLARAHVGLAPSRVAPGGDTEGGAPTVLLEMQATGMPLVATRHADIPAVVARPDELVPEEDVSALAEAILRVARATDSDWKMRLREGRALVEREHAAPRVAERLELVYDEALGRAGPAT